MAANAFLSSVLDLCLPALCPACQIQAGSQLCPDCQQDAPRIVTGCPRCGAETVSVTASEEQTNSANVCAQCHDRGIPFIKQVFVRYAYAGVVRQLILQAKVKSRRSAHLALAKLLPAALLQDYPIDAVTVIPASPGRRYGPHLASTLAQSLARALNKPFVPFLKQSRLPAPQHALPAHMRKHNTADLFLIPKKYSIPARVLIVDDLITSGNTLASAARTLHAAGAQTVYAASAARTLAKV